MCNYCTGTYSHFVKHSEKKKIITIHSIIISMVVFIIEFVATQKPLKIYPIKVKYNIKADTKPFFLLRKKNLHFELAREKLQT